MTLIDNDMENERIWTLLARKLANEATTIELAELQVLLQSKPELQETIQDIEKHWVADVSSDADFLEATYLMHLDKMQQNGVWDEEVAEEEDVNMVSSAAFSQSANTYAKYSLLSLLVLFIGWGIYQWQSGSENQLAVTENATQIAPKVISTKHGSRTRVDLPDGTKVWLNAGSSLSYQHNFGSNNRNVTLVGEAYFDVVKNTEKPFIIHTNKMDIKVLGTAFNVSCYPNARKVETSLIRGSIEVTLLDRPKEKIYLKPNDKLTLLDNIISNNSVGKLKTSAIATQARNIPQLSISHITYLPIDNSVVETSWINNKLVFSSETFEEVSQKMEKWYDVNIQFTDEKLKQVKLTGSFERETIVEALSALQLTTPFQFQISNQRNITISN